MDFDVLEGRGLSPIKEVGMLIRALDPVRLWIWRIPPWDHSIFGGKADAGNGEASFGSSRAILISDRDVAAGIAILEEAGGLVTTANPPDDPVSGPIPEMKLRSRLYLAIRYALPSRKLGPYKSDRVQSSG